jgi:hypothetical protein
MSSWSMKKERELIQLARANVSADLIAAKLETTKIMEKLPSGWGSKSGHCRPSKTAG